MKNDKEILLTFSVIFILILISILTSFQGYIDIGDYADTSKFFAGDFNAKIRTSHSILYGLIHAPLMSLFNNFWILKISSVFFLSLMVFSIYFISNKKKYALLLTLFCPIIWYMAPWINPIQISSLFFLWGYFFLDKFCLEKKIIFLFYSGILFGISGSFWESAFYFAIIIGLCFLFDKKFYNIGLFLAGALIGMLPKLIIDQIFFGFAFYSLVKHFFAVISSLLYGGIYENPNPAHKNILDMILILILLPAYFFISLKREFWEKNRRIILFLSASILLILFIGSQIRYLLIIAPILILFLTKILNKKQIKRQIMIFLILILIVIQPYLIQIKYSTNGQEIGTLIKNIKNLEIKEISENNLIIGDLTKIGEDYSNQIFIVGPLPDDYQKLAHLYWGKEIKEFVSIQDYDLYNENNSILIEKTLCSDSKEWNRRDMCLSVILRRSIADKTDYESINYAISLEKDSEIPKFKKIKEYNLLSVFEKIE